MKRDREIEEDSNEEQIEE